MIKHKRTIPLAAFLILASIGQPLKAQDSGYFDCGKTKVVFPNFQAMIPDAPGKAVSQDRGLPPPPRGQRYGLIINGDTEERHQENADDVFRFMKAHYRIPDANIYFLSTRQGSGGIQMGGSLESLEKAAAELKERARGSDEIIVYITGHGDRDSASGEVFLEFTSSEGAKSYIDADPFAHLYLDDNQAGATLCFADQCCSGAFAQALTNTDKKVVAISAVNGRHSTNCFFFLNPYLRAFDDLKNDADHDGLVSEWEAYQTAKEESFWRHRLYLFYLKMNGTPWHETPEEMSSAQYLRSRGYSAPAVGPTR